MASSGVTTTTMKLSANAEREFRKLIDVVDRTVPFPSMDRTRLPIRVVFDTTTSSSQLGCSQGTTVTLFHRAFASSGLFLYSALHEVGHAVFALLNAPERAEFLNVLGVPESRWEKLVLTAAESDDGALEKAAIHEIRLLDEAFAEAYAEYWTKTEYLKARNEKLYQCMRKLFWNARGITHEGLGQAKSRAANFRCIEISKDD